MVLQSISPTSQKKIHSKHGGKLHPVDQLLNSVTSEWKLVERVLCHELGSKPIILILALP